MKFSIVFGLMFGSLIAAAQIGEEWRISGPDNVCVRECYVYQLVAEGGSAARPIGWSITDGLGNSISYQLLEDSTSIRICFGSNTAFTISALFPDGSILSRVVTPGSFSDLPVLVRTGQCQEIRPVGCIEVCQGIPFTIQVDGLELSQMEWQEFGLGGMSVIEKTKQMIRLEADVSPGRYELVYAGSTLGQCFFEGVICILVLPKPETGWEANYPILNDSIQLCLHQELRLRNTSAARFHQWLLPNGELSTSQTYSIGFEQPGEYIITQQVFDLLCQCSQSKNLYIKVLDASSPSILCTATVCQGDTATYETAADCAPYIWTINGTGVIVAGGGPDDNFIQIHWTSSRLGQVSLTNACHDVCPIPTVVDIPIIGNENKIIGPSRVCLDETYIFETDPLSGGTAFKWNILPEGEILEGQGTSKIRARFAYGSSSRQVVVEYDNCHLECRGSDTLNVLVSRRFELKGKQQICSRDTAIWTAKEKDWPFGAVLCTWQLLNGKNEVVYEQPNPDANFSWPAAIDSGNFLIVATPLSGDFCQQDARISVQLWPVPYLNGNILGPEKYCPGTLLEYEVNAFDPRLQYNWRIEQGPTTIIQNSYPLQIQLTDILPIRIELTLTDPISGCASNEYEFFPLPLDTIEIDSDGIDCLFGQSTFRIKEKALDKITWSISDSNKGNVLDQPTAESIRFKWMEPGAITISAAYCGLQTTVHQTINDIIEPVINFPVSVCPGESAQVEVIGGWKTYRWYRDEVLVCQSATCSLPAGQYRLEAIDSLGCFGQTHFEISTYTIPNIQIAAPEGTGFCTGDSVLLTSTWIDDPRYIYTWLFQGAELTQLDHQIKVADYGVWQRRLTDLSTGCTYTTPPLLLCEFCQPGEVCYQCPCEPGDVCNLNDPKINANINTGTRCNEFTFEINTPGLVTGTVRWVIQAPSGQTFIRQEPTFTTRLGESGWYLVTLFAEYIDGMGIRRKPCPLIFNIEVTAVADFTFNKACLDTPTAFHSMATLSGNTQIMAYRWDFGDPSMGNANVSSPTYQYAASGVYPVTFRVETDKGCFTDTTKLVEVIPPSPIFWQYRAEICENEAFEISVDDTQLRNLEWFFDTDNLPAKIMDIHNPARHGYSNPGLYRFALKARDNNGCNVRRDGEVRVHPLPDPGNIITNTAFPACSGVSAILQSSVSNALYRWSTGESGSNITVNQTGIYGLTITDALGCQAITPNLIASFHPLPDSNVWMMGGENQAFSPDTLIVCEGESVIIQALAPAEQVSYLWNTGDTTKILSFDDREKPRLSAGTYTLSLTITDNNTGCQAQNNSIYIRVIAAPEIPSISGDRPLPWCSPDPVLLQVNNPQSAITYLWSTGDLAQSVTATSSGLYWVVAKNNFGCLSTSQTLEIVAPPSYSFLPEGCFIACEADTLCLPQPIGYQITQWWLDGTPMNPQPSDMQSPILSQSGSYAASLVTKEGCTYTSPSFFYDIVPGIGTLGGFLFEDINMDGVYQPGEPLIQGATIYLEGNNFQDSTTSGVPGTYYFRSLPLGRYKIRLDTLSLPTGYYVETDSLTVDIVKCDETQLGLYFPVKTCQSDTTQTYFKGCIGEKIQLGEMEWILEKDTIISIITPDGPCRDVVLFEIEVYPTLPPLTQTLSPCVGDYIDLLGLRVERDTFLVDTLSDSNGCDSILWYDVRFRPLEQSNIALNRCPDGEVWFRNIRIDRDTSFVYRASATGSDCDTLIQVVAVQYQLQSPGLNLIPSCPGKADGALQISSNSAGQITLNGVDYGDTRFIRPLPPGSFELIWTDSNQCRQIFDLYMEERDSLQGNIPEKIISCGEEITLQIEIQSSEDSTLQALWQNGQTGLSISVSRPGIYLAEIKNACESKILRGLVSDRDDGRTQLYFVPSAYTPNDDGINEGFKTYWPDDVVIESFLLEVFDRWGQLQFKSTDPEAEWSGISKEQQEKVATYVWKLNAVVEYCGEKRVIKDSGDITLIR